MHVLNSKIDYTDNYKQTLVTDLACFVNDCMLNELDLIIVCRIDLAIILEYEYSNDVVISDIKIFLFRCLRTPQLKRMSERRVEEFRNEPSTPEHSILIPQGTRIVWGEKREISKRNLVRKLCVH